MLKTNSKKAQKNLLNYVVSNLSEYAADGYNLKITESNAYNIIDTMFHEEYYGYTKEHFINFASGLSCGNVFDYFLHDAVNTLGEILEETESEKSRFTETQAENLLTSMIYNNVVKSRNKKG